MTDTGARPEEKAPHISSPYPRKVVVELSFSGHYLLHFKLRQNVTHTGQGPPHQKTDLCDNHCLNTTCLKKTRSFESVYTTGILSPIFADKELGENKYDRLSSKFRTAQSNLFETERLSDQPYQLSAN